MIQVIAMLNLFLKKRSKLLIFSCLIFPINLSVAQEPESHMTLSQSYNVLYEKSETYNNYKVFKISSIKELWNNVQDSLNYYKGEITSGKNEISQLNSQIKKLDTRIGNLENTLQQTRNVADSISVLGLLIPKITYNIIVWSVILGLCIILFIGYSRFKWSNNRYSMTRHEFHKLLNDFDRFKKSAQEKKIRLGRELQTERNKVVELESRLRGIDGNL